MKRISIEPRRDWQQKVEEKGLLYHTTDTGAYWNEAAYYTFTMGEIDAIEAATNTLQQMCLEAGQRIIDKDLFGRMGIAEPAARLIRQTWESEPPAIYGRFDLAYNPGTGAIKLLEYNADTPTSLLEASVIQWFWSQDCFPGKDQFNSIHERLVAKWKELIPYVGAGGSGRSMVHFACLENAEDIMTITYLADTAREAGLEVSDLAMSEIGHDAETGHFVDLENRRIETLFKLYPWEDLFKDSFGQFVERSGTQFMEPAWKMLWSNKAILPVLWQMYPKHELLLPAYFDRESLAIGGRAQVQKPFLSREGANITKFGADGQAIPALSTEGPYSGPYIYQEDAQLLAYDGRFPVLGSWVIDGESAGIGIREDASTITGNKSQFVPHVIE